MTFHAHARKKKRGNAEESLQRAVVQALKLRRQSGVFFYHVPNGEVRSKVTGSRLKAMGVLAGVADLTISMPGGRVRYLELKAPRGRQTDAQREFERMCIESQTPYEIARSFDEAMAILVRWGAIKPMRIMGNMAA